MRYKCPACGYQPDKQLAMKQTIEILKDKVRANGGHQ